MAPVALPETWIAGAAQLGQVITDTSNISPEFMQGILGFAPEQLAELTPEMWRALEPDVAALALPVVGETLDPTLLVQLIAIQNAAKRRHARTGGPARKLDGRCRCRRARTHHHG